MLILNWQNVDHEYILNKLVCLTQRKRQSKVRVKNKSKSESDSETSNIGFNEVKKS